MRSIISFFHSPLQLQIHFLVPTFACVVIVIEQTRPSSRKVKIESTECGIALTGLHIRKVGLCVFSLYSKREFMLREYILGCYFL